jgi:hypothetical protein
LRSDFFARADFPEFAALNADSRPHIARIGLAAALLIGPCALLARPARIRSPALGATLTLVSVGVIGVARQEVTEPASTAMAYLSDAEDTRIADAREVALDTRIPWWVRFPLTFEHHWQHVTEFHGASSPPPSNASLVFLARDDATSSGMSWPGPGLPDGLHFVAVRGTAIGPEATPLGWVAWKR